MLMPPASWSVSVSPSDKAETLFWRSVQDKPGSGNFLVTPFYAEKGGTVLDWVEPTLEESEETPTADVKSIRK